MSMGATPRQMELLRFIAGFERAKGYSPCFREMARGIGAPHKSKVWNLLRGLAERGLIRRLPVRARAIEVLAQPAVPAAPDGARLFAVPQVWKLVPEQGVQRLVFSGEAR